MTARIVLAAAIAAIAIAVSAAGVSASDPAPKAQPAAGLDDVRRATARYHDESRARRDGYVPAGECAELPGEGAMGVHYVNPPLASDAGHEPGMPVHYDLHAYLWHHNPSGMFAPWNPAMSCE